MGVDSQAACLVDGPIDDYESWDGEFAEELSKDTVVLYVDDWRVSLGGRFLTVHSGNTELKPPLLRAVK